MKSIGLSLNRRTRKTLKKDLQFAKKQGDLTRAKRIMAILSISMGNTWRVTASVLNISEETVRLNLRSFLLHGHKGLCAKKSPGRPPKLKKRQKKKLYELIKEGPTNSGFPGECWRSPMIQTLIHEQFGVFYSVAYIAQLLKNIGLSFQKAKFVAADRDEKARARWIKETWPEIQALAVKKNAMIVFGDEVSFPQWGTLSYTWAPIGETPIINTCGKRKGYKIYGLIEFFTGKVFSKSTQGKFNANGYMDFLEDVLDSTEEKHIILIQDGAKYHNAKDTKIFFEDNSDRMTVFNLPTYSPDFNPIEKLWKKIKDNGIHLHYFPTFESLMEKVDSMLELYTKEAKEVLKLMGFYQRRRDYIYS